MNNQDKRKIVISCIEKWQLAYQITRNDEHLDKCIEELTGFGKFKWFTLLENGDYRSHPDCDEINYDPKKQLKILSEIQNFNSLVLLNEYWKKVEKKIFLDLFRHVLSRFNEVLTIFDETTRRLELTDIFILCYNCQEKIPYEEKNKFIELAKECRSKDLLFNWLCEKWVLKDIEDSYDFSKFPLKFNSIKDGFFFLTQIPSSDINDKHLSLLSENYLTATFKELRNRNKMKRWSVLIVIVLLTLCVCIYGIYSIIILENGNVEILGFLLIFNIILFMVGIEMIRKKHFDM